MAIPITEKRFETPIGQVVCKLITDACWDQNIETKNYKNGTSVSFAANGYRIEIVEFKIKTPLFNGDTIIDSRGWLWRIEKIQETSKILKISCVLTDYENNVGLHSDTGHHLDAIEASNKDWKLHLGTEDGETLRARAESNDWFPERLRDKVSLDKSITTMLKDGFITEIPELKQGEQIYIQYLCAFDKNDHDSVNTWLAVEESKRKLEKWIRC